MQSSGTTVEDFLADDGTTGSAELVIDLGQILEVSGSLVLVGVLAFAIVCLPDRRPTTALETILMIAGLVVAIGAIASISGRATVLGLEFGDVLTDRFLDGARFRVVAGTIVAFGALASERWRQLPFLVGAILSATSFGLDGHTVTEGPRLLMVVINLAHVMAAGVWSGGTVALLVTIIQSRAADTPKTAIPAANRFSSLATVVLVPVFVSGTVMSVLILDGWSELFSTPWGRVLLIKLGAVGAALLLGAHHRFRVVPHLEDRPHALVGFRRTMTIEVAVLCTVAVLTGLLVSASTS